MNDIIGDVLSAFLRFVLPCRSLLSFKLRGLTILATALLADLGLKFWWKPGDISLQISGPEMSISFAMIILFIFLVVVDFIIFSRNQSLQREVSKLLTNPDLPDDIKRAIAESILSKGNRIY